MASRCNFSLGEIRALYRYPQQHIVPPGHSPGEWLRQLTQQGARERYPQGVPEAVDKAYAALLVGLQAFDLQKGPELVR